MSEESPEKPDLIAAMIWLLGPESQEARSKALRGTYRINFDPHDPTRAWRTLPDETVIHGRLLENGDFIPDQEGAEAATTSPSIDIASCDGYKASTDSATLEEAPAAGGKSKRADPIAALIWLLGPEGRQLRSKALRGTHRINCDPHDPTRAWCTLPDETVVHGRLLDNGDFVPEEANEKPPPYRPDDE